MARPVVARPVVVVAGPTASGKSALAVALGRRFDGTVINADSMQLYRELAVLTARPAAERVDGVPHRLYGVLAAGEAGSVGSWRELAAAEIEAAHAAGRLPIVVGGSGMYLRALMTGLARIPAVPPAIRAEARDLLSEIGNAALHARLAASDPAGAARIRPADSQRLLRGWEVLLATGRPLAEWQGAAAPAHQPGWRFATVLLMPPRPVLYAACDRRFAAMVAAGAVDEVRALTALGLGPRHPASKALGLREIARFLAGEVGFDEMLASGQRATRRYAKRQMTWFRNQIVADLVVSEQLSQRVYEEIFAFIIDFLLTPSP